MTPHRPAALHPVAPVRRARGTRPLAAGLCGHRGQRLVYAVARAMATARAERVPLALALFETTGFEGTGGGSLPALLGEAAPGGCSVHPLGDARAALLMPGVGIDVAVPTCEGLRRQIAERLGSGGEDLAVGIAGLGSDVVAPTQFVTWAAAAAVTARRRAGGAGARTASVALA